jgi:hypothetical protein
MTLLTRGLLAVTIALSSLFASADAASLKRDKNFIIFAETEELAERSLETANKYRKMTATELFGSPLPESIGPSIIYVRLGEEKSTGRTWPKDTKTKRYHTVWVYGETWESIQTTFRHEIAHTVVMTRYPKLRSKWLHEGLACRFDDQFKKDYRQKVIDYFEESGNWPDLKTAMTLPVIGPKDVAGYAIGASVTDYLLTIGTVDDAVKFAIDADANGYADALEAHYGLTFPQLAKRWRSHVTAETYKPTSATDYPDWLPTVSDHVLRLTHGNTWGSGTYLTNGYVLTAAHVVRNVETATAIFRDGFQTTATVEARSKLWDVALVQLDRPHPSLPGVELATKNPIKGDRLYMLGYDGGRLPLMVREGDVGNYSRPTENPNGPTDWYSVVPAQSNPAVPGNSGGGVFNANGRLVGPVFLGGQVDSIALAAGRTAEFLDPYRNEIQSCYGGFPGFCPTPQPQFGRLPQPQGRKVSPTERPKPTPPPTFTDDDKQPKLTPTTPTPNYQPPQFAIGDITIADDGAGDVTLTHDGNTYTFSFILPRGPAGLDGEDGENGSTPPVDDIVELVLCKLETRIDDKLNSLSQDVSESIVAYINAHPEKFRGPKGDTGPAGAPATASEAQRHFVVIADPNAPYFDRLAGEVEKTKHRFDAIRLIEPPTDRNVGTLPALVLYVGATPVVWFHGASDVYRNLSRIQRGTLK